MRTAGRVGLTLLFALALSTTVFAQTVDDRISLNAAVGPSFANVGTTFSTRAALDVALNDRTTVFGEFGVLPHAGFEDASEIAVPFPSLASPSRVNAYHWNGNVLVRPFITGRIQPYVTGGVGSFTADTIVENRSAGSRSFEDRRRMTNVATNLGAGLTYRFNNWIGVNADFRTFFVHRDGDTPRVDRFTTGLSLFLK